MSDWWSKKLGGAPANPPRGNTPHIPAAPPPEQQPMAQVPQAYAPGQPSTTTAPQQQGDPNEEVSLTDRLQTTTYDQVPAQAQAQKQSTTCPGCGSGNYYTGTAQGGGAHCHDCGYPLVQSGSGMGALAGVRPTGPGQMAKSPVYTQQLGG